MKKIEIRPNGTKRVYTVNEEPTRTQQQFKDKVNINSIMAKYKKTGLIDHIRSQPGTYTDLTQLPDYQTAMNTVIHAQETFSTLPSAVRARFGHDPQSLISFLADPKNDSEAVSLGLKLQKQPEPAPVEKTKPKKDSVE